MIHSLQVYRGFAAILVLLLHTEKLIIQYKLLSDNKISSIFDFGHTGVYFFFVLSGFIIFYIHDKDIGKKELVINYIKKRLIRIYPPYAVLLFSLLPFWILIGSLGEEHHSSIDSVIRSIFLIPFEIPKYPHIGVAWTLSHEMLFYLLFALLILHKKFGGFVMTVWLITILLFRNQFQYPLSFLLSEFNLLFFLGILAFMTNKKLEKNSKIGIYSFFIGNALFIGFSIFYSYLSEYNTVLLYGFASFLIIAPAGNGYIENLFKKRIFFKFLGDSSYSIYLVHMISLAILCKISSYIAISKFLPNYIIIFVTFASISLIAGIIFHLIIEKPFLKYLRKKIL